MPKIEKTGRILPFENLETTARDLSVNFTDFTYKNLREGWERDKFRISTVLPPVDWNAHNRSFSYHLHAWDAIADLLMAHDRLKDEAFFEASLAHARAWVEEFQMPLVGKDSDAELDALVHPKMPVEWYDMAVGLRAYRIAYILDILVETGRDERDIEMFYLALAFHMKLLRRDHFFRAHSNHGLYQALGHLAAARRFHRLTEFHIDHDIATARFRQILETHFSKEGPHAEHSPGYHFMILGTIINARRSGLFEDQEAIQAVARIENAFSWMVGPDWRVATIGDTDPRGMVRQQKQAELFLDPATRYIISGGSQGDLPTMGVKPYYDAGYAFARVSAPESGGSYVNASYLAQTAAFHSRVHKHADHLSFIWHDRNRDILIDPGRYAYAGRTEIGSDLFNQGFWYSDPKRIYVESTRAHNCVEIDSKSYPRRSVKPFGSALCYAGEQNGLAVTDCEVTHLRSVRHRRVIVMAPRHFLLVLDWLNDRTAEHDFRQWFQFAPEWIVAPSPNGLVATVPSQEAGVQTGALDPFGVFLETPGTPAAPQEKLSIVNLIDENAFAPPVCGQTEPELQGWMSDAAYSLVPSTSICVEALGRQMGRFATLFCFGEASVDRAATRFNTTLRAGTVRWRDGGGEHKLALSLGEPGSASAKLTSS